LEGIAEDAIGPAPRIGHIGSFSLNELTKNNEAALAASVAAQLQVVNQLRCLTH
jgi:hypothetical protein